MAVDYVSESRKSWGGKFRQFQSSGWILRLERRRLWNSPRNRSDSRNFLLDLCVVFAYLRWLGVGMSDYHHIVGSDNLYDFIKQFNFNNCHWRIHDIYDRYDDNRGY